LGWCVPIVIGNSVLVWTTSDLVNGASKQGSRASDPQFTAMSRKARRLTVAIWRQLSELRLRAVPQLKQTGPRRKPPACPWPDRSSLLALPGDAEAANKEQWRPPGSKVLVAPVVTEAASARSVYIPPRLLATRQDKCARHRTMAAGCAYPLASVPWFHRCGASPL